MDDKEELEVGRLDTHRVYEVDLYIYLIITIIHNYYDIHTYMTISMSSIMPKSAPRTTACTRTILLPT